jgi:hypothetical protein
VGAALLALAVMADVQRYLATHHRVAIVPGQVMSASTDHPSEAPVPDEYEVASTAPRQLILPSIQTKGFIQPVAVDQHGAMAVPQNIHLAGWYVRGARPGDPGLSIIDGHVSGHYLPGIFAHLTSLKSGHIFTVQYGDKSERQFKVRRLITVSTEEANSRLYERDSNIRSQLNLITCTGSYDTANHGYDERLIVVAESIAKK